MTISVLVPCFNEEQTIKACIGSILSQTHTVDEIIVVNDGSTDSTHKILKSFGKKITVVSLKKNSGNKGYAIEAGLPYIKTDVFISTDADTILDPNFVLEIKKSFKKGVNAVSGRVRSHSNNLISQARAIEYSLSQTIHKPAQSVINSVLVVPGCAGAFKTKYFKKTVILDHTTVTEDQDYTFQILKKGGKVVFNPNAVVFTQDPETILCYIRQLKRWYSGGWQNIIKHRSLIEKPEKSFEIALMYFEGLAFAILLFALPLIDIRYYLVYSLPILILSSIFAVVEAMRSKNWNILKGIVPFFFLTYLNAFIFIQTFINVAVLQRKTNSWARARRRAIA